MIIVINPKYNQLTSFIKSIPDIFPTQGNVIYNERNQLKTFIIDGYNIVVKSFRKPNVTNKIVYGNFRKSKAKRSFENALKLLDKGFSTPDPIAYIQEKKFGLFSRSYYISIYEIDYKHIREQMIGQNVTDEFLCDVANLIARLHNEGILHKDLSPGNILTRQINNTLEFSLVDINRMIFQNKISKKIRFKSFKRLSENEKIITQIAKFYAAATNLDESESIEKIKKYSSRFISSKK